MNLIRYRKPNKDISQNPCHCLICGERLDPVTHAHAEKHGYSDKWEFIKSGKTRQIKGSRFVLADRATS